MKMKSLIAFAVAGLAAGAVRADLSSEAQYLYWDAQSMADAPEFSYVQLKYAVTGTPATETAGWNTIGDIVFGTGVDGAKVMAADATSPSFVMLASGMDWSAYSFLAEFLLNDGSSETSLGLSQVVAFSSLADSVYANMDVGEGALSSQTFSLAAVPEPTSGILLLLGFAGLALRRKRV